MRGLVALAVLAASCGTHQVLFFPVRSADAGARPGEYPLETSDGQRGIARVWTRGIHREEGRDLVHVAIELESSGRVGMRVDASALRLQAHKGDETTPPLRSSSTSGPSEVPPRGYGRLEVYFALPADTRPSSVTSFDLTWAAQLGDRRLDEVTHFEHANMKVRSRMPVAHGPFMPGSGTRSPTGEWYTCPDDPFHYYPYPPECL